MDCKVRSEESGVRSGKCAMDSLLAKDRQHDAPKALPRPRDIRMEFSKMHILF